ncbi:prepilin peptidase [Celerinatantimonas diazotrophica]|uniref:Prepilin leader peptidase/N-methyltransferase n=1 Tax=Celerinatantimonas diazotrophica TaxID=412034 RepID=A0A4R1K2C1_9GAMM|nr:A24 family peptidase [Celerinatantimonas diazotrophica]TCK57977.1 leader peptidase (prepilin peptidase)/N-methyltransferase [Celerinatantimonas diazotrophica]CAG9297954.1 Type 4 prepilin-like proteins leader peptide-processing enzyme [Celerinatantimonas diazotrophica]
MAYLHTIWQQLPIFFWVLCVAVALVIGSFMNVLIYRLPLILKRQWKNECETFLAEIKDEPQLPQGRFDLAYPRSQCPHCHHKIPFWWNIPVLSFILLRGRCHNCRQAISWRYPIVELLSVAITILLFWRFSLSIQWLWACVFALALIAAACIDLKTLLLPDQLTLPLLWLGLLVNTHQLFVSTHQSLWGAAFGYSSLWVLYWCFKLLTKKEGMGYGDFKLFAAIGAWLGWSSLPIILLFSSAAGALVGIAVLAKQRKRQQLQLPFGPFLAASALVYLVFGEQIYHLYWMML